MATGGAADGLVRYGCLSGGDMGVERRPYHRNCGCALCKKSSSKQGHNNSCASNMPPRCKTVSYPIRRSWSEGCLAMVASNFQASPSSSPSMQVVDKNNSHYQLEPCNDDDEDGIKFASRVLKI